MCLYSRLLSTSSSCWPTWVSFVFRQVFHHNDKKFPLLLSAHPPSGRPMTLGRVKILFPGFIQYPRMLVACISSYGENILKFGIKSVIKFLIKNYVLRPYGSVVTSYLLIKRSPVLPWDFYLWSVPIVYFCG